MTTPLDQNDVVTTRAIVVAAVKAAIDAADPIGLLRIGVPDDEDESEAATIAPRAAAAADVSDVRRIVHEEFGWWFGVDIAGPLERYEAPARAIWQAVLEFRRME